jgi:glycosyltransferase involved in cell wall biosynthesis
MSLVSIIIPTYNYGTYIKQAIDSVLDQSYKNFEIIVADDGSTDNTKNLIQTQYPNEVRYYYQQNKGPGAARNLGLKYIRGEYIVFLDADDSFLPKNLETKITLLEKQPQIDWAFSDAIFHDEGGNFMRKGSDHFHDIYYQTDFPPDDIFASLLNNGNFISTACLMARRRCFDKLPNFDEELRMHQDYLQWLQLAKYFPKYAYIDSPLVHIRRHKKSWGRNKKLSLEQRIKLYHKLESLYFRELNMFQNMWKRRFADAYNQLAIIEMTLGSKKTAVKYFIDSLKKHPTQKFAYINLFRCMWI